MPAMLSGHGRKSIAPQGAPTNPTTPLVGAGHARDASCPRAPKSIAPQGAPTDPPHHPVGAGHARDAFLPTRTENHHALGRSYSAFAPIPNPHRIPERVVAHAFHQPCPDGIGDQITRGSPHVIVTA